MIIYKSYFLIFIGLVSAQESENSGCEFDPWSPMFHQQENVTSPVGNWNFTILSTEVVENTINWPNYRWMPDGHISTLQDPFSGDWYTFYPNHESYRSISWSPLPENALLLDPKDKVIGGKLNYDSYHNGGEWLNAVFATNPEFRGLTGFVHAEDHYWDGESLTGHGKAYKSISLVCGYEFGKSWERQDQILTVGHKPETPMFAGIGDFDVVWDWQNSRWFLLASHLRGAVSYDKSAKANSWKKWNGTDFSVDNFIEEGERFLDTEGHALPDGEHPTIHWNRYLQQWVVAWNDYGGNIWITTARSLPNFVPPRILLPKRTEDQKNWYPNIIHSSLGDRLGDNQLHLYWRDFPEGIGNGNSIFKKIELEIFALQDP